MSQDKLKSYADRTKLQPSAEIGVKEGDHELLSLKNKKVDETHPEAQQTPNGHLELVLSPLGIYLLMLDTPLWWKNPMLLFKLRILVTIYAVVVWAALFYYKRSFEYFASQHKYFTMWNEVFAMTYLLLVVFLPNYSPAVSKWKGAIGNASGGLQVFICIFYWVLLFPGGDKSDAFEVYLSIHRHGFIMSSVVADLFCNKQRFTYKAVYIVCAFAACYTMLHFYLTQFTDVEIYSTDVKITNFSTSIFRG